MNHTAPNNLRNGRYKQSPFNSQQPTVMELLRVRALSCLLKAEEPIKVNGMKMQTETRKHCIKDPDGYR